MGINNNGLIDNYRLTGAALSSLIVFQELIKLIFDVKKMTETVVEMQYDANKVSRI